MTTESISVYNGKGSLENIPAAEWGYPSGVLKEKDNGKFYFVVFKRGGGVGWRISHFPSEIAAKKELGRIDLAIGQIAGFQGTWPGRAQSRD